MKGLALFLELLDKPMVAIPFISDLDQLSKPILIFRMLLFEVFDCCV
jgi:hypothetical protein